LKKETYRGFRRRVIYSQWNIDNGGYLMAIHTIPINL
jgi:hypothetical protein